MALHLEDPLPSSNLNQDGSSNSPNSVLKLNVSIVFHWFLSVSMIGTCYFGLSLIAAIWVFMIKSRVEHEGNDVFYLIPAGVFLCFTIVFCAYWFILTVETITMTLLHDAIYEKLLHGDKGYIEIEAPTWFRGFRAGVPCCLFSLLAAMLGWQTNNYLEMALSKNTQDYADPDPSKIIMLYAIPYCFGLVSSVALAFVFFFVTIATTLNVPEIKMPFRPDPVSHASARERFRRANMTLIMPIRVLHGLLNKEEGVRVLALVIMLIT